MRKILLTLFLAATSATVAHADGGHFDVVNGIYYYMRQPEDGPATATVYPISDYFLDKGVPQYSGDIVIPATFDYDGVTFTVVGIGSSAFEDCTGITSVSIPPTVAEVGSAAFCNDDKLKAVYIEDLKAWCDIEFSSMSYTNPLEYAHNLYLNDELLTDIVIPDGVTKIGNIQFFGCNMESVAVPEGVATVGTFAFGRCKNLKTVILPSSLEALQNGAFISCESIESIDIPENVTKLADDVFNYCLSLRSVKLPAAMIEIGSLAFRECTSLSEITLPRDLRIIGESAFLNCSSLSQLRLPAQIESISEKAFYWSTSWETINIPETLKVIGQSSFDCSNLNILTSRCTELPDPLGANTPFYQAKPHSAVAAFPTVALTDYRNDSRFSDFMMEKNGDDKPKIKVTLQDNAVLEFAASQFADGAAHWGELVNGMTLFAPKGTELVWRLPEELHKDCRILYNGQDMTQSLEAGLLRLPALTTDSTLEFLSDAAVEAVDADLRNGEFAIYTLDGMQLDAGSLSGLKSGMYILRYADGHTKKIRI